jgi:hypothetical protein
MTSFGISEEQKMSMSKKKLIWIAPAALIGMTIFIAIGGMVVMLLWNWLATALFGLPMITFWQAFGLLALCRILFGGFGLGGGGRCNRKHTGERIRDRMRERMDERWENMTPEERERLRQGLYDRGQTTPLDSDSAG